MHQLVRRLRARGHEALVLEAERAEDRQPGYRWIANAIYLLMKPAEAVFLIALLFLDPGDPESRIDRMYR